MTGTSPGRGRPGLPLASQRSPRDPRPPHQPLRGSRAPDTLSSVWALPRGDGGTCPRAQWQLGRLCPRGGGSQQEDPGPHLRTERPQGQAPGTGPAPSLREVQTSGPCPSLLVVYLYNRLELRKPFLEGGARTGGGSGTPPPLLSPQPQPPAPKDPASPQRPRLRPRGLGGRRPPALWPAQPSGRPGGAGTSLPVSALLPGRPGGQRGLGAPQ